MKNVWTWIVGIWKDPVWSKVIASIIIGAGIFLWDKFDESSFLITKTFLTNVLDFKISLPVWGALLGIVIIWLFRRIIRRIPSKNAVPPRNPILDKRVGNYTFEEFYKILGGQKLRVQTQTMVIMGMAAPDGTLLQLFLDNYNEFKKGVSFGDVKVLRSLAITSINDGGYLIEVLSPKLLEYNLIEIKSIDHGFVGSAKSLVTTFYSISPIGEDFFECFKILHLPPQPVFYRSS